MIEEIKERVLSSLDKVLGVEGVEGCDDILELTKLSFVGIDRF